MMVLAGSGKASDSIHRLCRFSIHHASILFLPDQYNNIWIESMGGVIQWTCIYGLNQMAMQRYCSMPSLKHARLVLSLTIPANLLIRKGNIITLGMHQFIGRDNVTVSWPPHGCIL